MYCLSVRISSLVRDHSCTALGSGYRAWSEITRVLPEVSRYRAITSFPCWLRIPHVASEPSTLAGHGSHCSHLVLLPHPDRRCVCVLLLHHPYVGTSPSECLQASLLGAAPRSYPNLLCLHLFCADQGGSPCLPALRLTAFYLLAEVVHSTVFLLETLMLEFRKVAHYMPPST